jgi:hypothetical protein
MLKKITTRHVWIFGTADPSLLVIDAKDGLRVDGVTGLRIDFEYGGPTIAALRFGKTEELVIVEEIVIKGPTQS